MRIRGIVGPQLRLFATFAVLALWCAPAAAGSFSHSYRAMTVGDGATLGPNSIRLPSAGTPVFEFSFVLPADYKANAKVAIALYLLTDPGELSCTVVIEPYLLRRHREGLVANEDGTLAGIEPANGDPSAGFPGQTLARKVFNLKKSPEFPGQRAGDLIVLGFYRNASHVLDSCPNHVDMLGVDIRYPSATP
jgi:hypothetical protein